MAHELIKPNNYSIYCKELNAKTILEDGQEVPRVATNSEVESGTSTTTAISPASAKYFSYDSYNKTKGIFWNFTGNYNNSSQSIVFTGFSQSVSQNITIPANFIATINSIGKRSTYMINASLILTMTTGQNINLKIKNINTLPSDPVIGGNTVSLTYSVDSGNRYVANLSGLVDIVDNLCDVQISITGITDNGGVITVQSGSYLNITEL